MITEVIRRLVSHMRPAEPEATVATIYFVPEDEVAAEQPRLDPLDLMLVHRLAVHANIMHWPEARLASTAKDIKTFMRGRDDRRVGIKLEDNPYPKGGDWDWYSWRAGWMDLDNELRRTP